MLKRHLLNNTIQMIRQTILDGRRTFFPLRKIYNRHNRLHIKTI